MANEPVYILTPVGRLVQGHPMEATEQVDDRTKQKKVGADGKPIVQYYMALAFPKTDPAFMRDVWPQMAAVAQRDWPQGQYNAPNFAWKLVDGDGIDKQGKPYKDREGFAGHYILKITSGYPYQVVGQDGRSTIVDVKAIKRGDYMRAYVGVKGNAPSQSPGLYINPSFAQLVGYGDAIRSGPDAAAILATAPAAVLPAGASAMPIAATPMPAALPQTTAPQPAYQPAQMQMPAALPSPQTAGYAPNPGILMPPGVAR